MTLREEFINSGNWLFRRRAHLPLIMLLALLLVMLHTFTKPDAHFDYRWEALCLAVSFFGLAIRIVTVGHTPKGTSGRNSREQIADELNTAGIYSLVRNPLYLGNFFMYLGVSLFPRLWWFTILFILVFWLYYERIIFAEEAFLKEKFGDEYMDWSSSTPVFLPKFRGYRRNNLPFSLRNVLRREYNGFFNVIAAMFLLEVVGDFVSDGGFEFDPVWLVMLGTAFCIWIVLRTLKRRTTILDVDGR